MAIRLHTACGAT